MWYVIEENYIIFYTLIFQDFIKNFWAVWIVLQTDRLCIQTEATENKLPRRFAGSGPNSKDFLSVERGSTIRDRRILHVIDRDRPTHRALPDVAVPANQEQIFFLLWPWPSHDDFNVRTSWREVFWTLKTYERVLQQWTQLEDFDCYQQVCFTSWCLRKVASR